MPRQSCSVCERPGAREAVDRLLQTRTPLKVIAAEVGISKSSIHRHSKTCVVRSQAANVRSANFDPQRDRTFVIYENGIPGGTGPEAEPQNIDKFVAEFGVRENDWIISVEYDPPLPPRESKVQPSKPAEAQEVVSEAARTLKPAI